MGDTVWSAVGFCFNLIASLLIVLAFSTPYWIEPDEGKIIATQLERLGLWEICFASYSDIHDGLGRIYNGCWWIFAREYDNIRRYLITGWFATTQALMTVSLVFSLCTVLAGLLLLLRCLPSKVQKYTAYFTCLSLYLIGLFAGIACISFGTHAATDSSWLKQRNFRHLSWSFYVAVFGGIMSIFSALFYSMYSIKLRAGGHRSTAYRAHEMRHYRPR